MKVLDEETMQPLIGYANDIHPRVSTAEMERAITETENRYGVDFDDFDEKLENEAINLAVQYRLAHEQDWFDGSENSHE